MRDKNFCTPEQKAECPLKSHYGDTHHLAFPSKEYRTKLQKEWRELAINKVKICRGLHEAIHHSGYLPPHPDREEMAAEVWGGAVTDRSQEELAYQLSLGNIVLGGEAA